MRPAPTPLLGLLIALLAAPAQGQQPDPRSPDFWFVRARDLLLVAPVVEYDEETRPRLTAFECASDLFKAAPSDEHRELLRLKLEAGAQQLEFATQPWRRWYGHLELARVCRAALGDEKAYNAHREAAAALTRWLPPEGQAGVRYADTVQREIAAAGDGDGLIAEVSRGPAGVSRLDQYARIARACAWLGQTEGALTALAPMSTEASRLPPGPERDLSWVQFATVQSSLGRHAEALAALVRIDGDGAKVEAALHVLRAARKAKSPQQVTGAVRLALADVRAGAVGRTVVGDLVAELAASGDAEEAVRIGRAAMETGPDDGEPALYYAALAGGFADAVDREDYASASKAAREAIDVMPAEDATRARALLLLARAHARAGEWESMNRCATDVAGTRGLSEADLAVERRQLLDAMLERRRWDDAMRLLSTIRPKADREAWMPRVVAAQVRGGALSLAVENARKLDGYVRARCWRRIALERARAGDFAGLAAWVDEMGTPLRRAATNVAIGQVLAGKPIPAAGFPEDSE